MQFKSVRKVHFDIIWQFFATIRPTLLDDSCESNHGRVIHGHSSYFTLVDVWVYTKICDLKVETGIIFPTCDVN